MNNSNGIILQRQINESIVAWDFDNVLIPGGL